MTQKEKYKRAREAMRMTLRHIDAAAPDIEDCLREVVDAVSAELPKIEGIAVEAEKLETEDEPKKLTRAAVLEKARACISVRYSDSGTVLRLRFFSSALVILRFSLEIRRDSFADR